MTGAVKFCGALQRSVQVWSSQELCKIRQVMICISLEQSRTIQDWSSRELRKTGAVENCARLEQSKTVQDWSNRELYKTEQDSSSKEAYGEGSIIL